MAIFSKREILVGDTRLIPVMAKALEEGFRFDGFDVASTSLISGGYDISITKGNIFKAVLGMKTALKVTLMPHSSGILFEANVGIFGQQAIPTVISMFFLWPVLITQIWGMVEQSKLDDKALSICKDTLLRSMVSSQPSSASSFYSAPNASSASQSSTRFCTQCGAKISSTAKFCPECGAKLG